MLFEEKSTSQSSAENDDKLGRLSISELNCLNFRLNKNFAAKRRQRESNKKALDSNIDELNTSAPTMSTNKNRISLNHADLNTGEESIQACYNILNKYYKLRKQTN